MTAPEPLGARVARLRVTAGLTQAALAEKIAISRVTISHIEADLSWPNERTILLLAGVLGAEPGELVDGTNYPPGKADRLPETTMRFTDLEMNVALIERDLAWLERLDDDTQRCVVGDVTASWESVADVTRSRTVETESQERFIIAHGRLLDHRARLSRRE